MRTCPKCGCYIPDNWINCPACVAPVFSKKKTEWNPWKDGTHYTEEKLYKDSALMIYCVDVLYDYERIKTSEYFTQYKNALKYATKKVNEKDVLAVQIISGGGRIISTIEA